MTVERGPQFTVSGMNELPSNPRLIIITGGYFADRRPATASRLADDAQAPEAKDPEAREPV